MLKSAIGRLRAIGFLEGTSFLILLGVAMPLKYIAGEPQYVTYVGWVHGGLFMLYVLAIFMAFDSADWPLSRAAKAFFAGVVPFGTFVFDRSLKREEEERAQQAAA